MSKAPLKGREVGEARRAPPFPQLLPLVQCHLSLYVEDDPDAPFLTGVRGGPLEATWFSQRILEPARATFVEELRASHRQASSERRLACTNQPTGGNLIEHWT